MKAVTLGAAITLAFSTAAYAQAPSWTVPSESQRCPSKWGAADERGSANHQKPAAVLNAAKFIKTGEVIELAHVLGPNMAFFGTRRFDVHTKRTFMNQFSNMRGSNEEIVITELGQVGTQFDGFAHQTHLNSWYNCQKVDENADRGVLVGGEELRLVGPRLLRRRRSRLLGLCAGLLGLGRRPRHRRRNRGRAERVER